jgi:hypothetical protein
MSDRLICFDLDQKIDDIVADLLSNDTTRPRYRSLQSLSKIVNQQMTFDEIEKILHIVEFIASRSHTSSLKHKCVQLDLIINTCVRKSIDYFPYLDKNWLISSFPHLVTKYLFPRACIHDGGALCFRLVKKGNVLPICNNI